MPLCERDKERDLVLKSLSCEGGDLRHRLQAVGLSCVSFHIVS